MKLLGEIIHVEGLDLTGRILTRTAVRGIIRRESELLMIYSPVNGDFKFPGGGIEPGETDEKAHAPEVREECGVEGSEIGPAYGKMIEYWEAKDDGYDIFKMTSRYFRCNIEDTAFGQQCLDGYEKHLEFTPVWIDLCDAIRANEHALTSSDRPPPRWTRLETVVLTHLLAHPIVG